MHHTFNSFIATGMFMKHVRLYFSHVIDLPFTFFTSHSLTIKYKRQKKKEIELLKN